jgi:uncharacterized protein YegJ (DUF2314 family)
MQENSEDARPVGSRSGLVFRVIVSLLLAICGGMLWLWATQLDSRWNYLPALICFGVMVVVWLPRPTGRLGEILSRSLGVLFMALAIAAALGLILAGWEFTLRTVGGIALCLVLLATGWGRLFPDYYAPIPIDHDDPLMKAMIERARSELPRFRQAIEAGRKEAFVKFPLRSPGVETEHIWGVVHSLTDAGAQVSLANEPVHEHEGKDLRFAVPLADIEDWMLFDAGGVVEGGYTHLALARMYKREKGFLPHAMRKQLAPFRDLDLNQV